MIDKDKEMGNATIQILKIGYRDWPWANVSHVPYLGIIMTINWYTGGGKGL